MLLRWGTELKQQQPANTATQSRASLPGAQASKEMLNTLQVAALFRKVVSRSMRSIGMRRLYCS
jgi:hypothetical protein